MLKSLHLKCLHAGVVGAGISLCGSLNAGTVRFVNANLTTGADDGSSWSNAHRGPLGLRAALQASQAGNEIWVAAAVYTPAPAGNVSDSLTLVNGVAVYGGFVGNETAREQRDPAAHETILSGDVGLDDVDGSPVWHIGWNINSDNSRHVIDASGVDATTILDGFTITAGRATQTAGGGVYNIGGNPSIANCRFWRNVAAFGNGGAIYNLDAVLAIAHCTFVQNWVHLGQGAGIFNAGSSSLTITDCDFSENRCTGATPEAAGGGICHYANGAIDVDRCTFDSNVAESFYPSGSTSGGYGGAIFQLFGTMTISNSRFTANRSNAGGAVCTFSSATIVNCMMRGNLAPEYQAQQGGWGGYGGAIGALSFHNDTVYVINCTLTNNTATRGGGIRFLSGVHDVIANCILWANADEFGSIGPSQISGANASFSCIQNMLVGIPGEDPPDPADFPNCIAADPLFVNQGTGDVHLTHASPCIDAASNAAIPPGVSVDLDGRPRTIDGDGDATAIVDMGALEYQPFDPCPADIAPQPIGDGVVDINDLLFVIAAWGTSGGPADVNGDNIVNITDLLAVIAAWGACP